ncbi:hypothetical protein PMAC_002430 [Pneumocystis sp. 'macacae']|nr:hypothetical protein PMAC_002430 [Pneumocystis sp. 'macacae']
MRTPRDAFPCTADAQCRRGGNGPIHVGCWGVRGGRERRHTEETALAHNSVGVGGEGGEEGEGVGGSNGPEGLGSLVADHGELGGVGKDAGETGDREGRGQLAKDIGDLVAEEGRGVGEAAGKGGKGRRRADVAETEHDAVAVEEGQCLVEELWGKHGDLGVGGQSGVGGERRCRVDGGEWAGQAGGVRAGAGVPGAGARVGGPVDAVDGKVACLADDLEGIGVAVECEEGEALAAVECAEGLGSLEGVGGGRRGGRGDLVADDWLLGGGGEHMLERRDGVGVLCLAKDIGDLMLEELGVVVEGECKDIDCVFGALGAKVLEREECTEACTEGGLVVLVEEDAAQDVDVVGVHWTGFDFGVYRRMVSTGTAPTGTRSRECRRVLVERIGRVLAEYCSAGAWWCLGVERQGLGWSSVGQRRCVECRRAVADELFLAPLKDVGFAVLQGLALTLIRGWTQVADVRCRHVDQAILSEEERLVVIRFGRDGDEECMRQDEVLYKIAEKVVNFAVSGASREAVAEDG